MDLTPRLKKISELIPKNSSLADVGTDHAYLPVYCLLNGIINSAVAMDVNKGPLLRAEENVKKYSLLSSVSLRLSDGLDALKPDEADVVVIAGMGGLLIKRILENSHLNDGTLLLLQPMIAQKELRRFLYENSMAIEDEYLACEGKKVYNIIVARAGKSTAFDEYDIIIGRNLKNNSKELFKKYVQMKSNTLKKIRDGIEISSDKRGISEVKNELEFYLKELNEYEG